MRDWQKLDWQKLATLLLLLGLFGVLPGPCRPACSNVETSTADVHRLGVHPWTPPQLPAD